MTSVYSDLFNNRLATTLFVYFNNITRKEALKLLGVVLLSDGYLNNVSSHSPCIKLETISSSIGQHDLFHELCMILFNKTPRKYIFNKEGYKLTKMMSSELTITNQISILNKLNTNFKTTPGPVDKNEFLSSPQPTIKFLIDESQKTKELALSIWFDFDGSITPSFKMKRKVDIKNNKRYTYFQVQFECEIQIAETNPNLVKELKLLLDSMRLISRIKYSPRKWSGIDGIVISELKSVKKFVKIGPITDVVVSNKSKRLNGITKKEICDTVDKFLDSDKNNLSKYFKKREDALKYKTDLNSLLEDRIRSN